MASPHQKLVIFTEHRDTLTYLHQRIETLFGRPDACRHPWRHGRGERAKAQERFRTDAQTAVLLATDAAGEGINLQRAHLMVNYDLPWNPNRIEQRLGRIHRIGQDQVCHLWNLVAEETREGDVYHTLFAKLEEARTALGGQVFDVLGKVQFEGRLLRICSSRPSAMATGRSSARLTQAVEHALDQDAIRDLLDEHVLVHDAMDATGVRRIREDMERAELRRLQPYYVESFFLEAFGRLGGTVRQREPHRYEVTHVPAPVRGRDRLIGQGEPVMARYERIVFEKALRTAEGRPPAVFVHPGHPLLVSTIDLTLERHRDLLRRGTVLVDERDPGTDPRVLFYLEHAVADASVTRSGERRVISKRVLFVELGADGTARHIAYAPYLDYRPLAADEPVIDAILARPEAAWVTRDIEGRALAHAIETVVPEHLAEVREPRLALLAKTEAAVKERLTREINHWDHRAAELRDQERAGKLNARLNSDEAAKRADGLQARLSRRMEEIALERQISALPPVVLGGLLVVPAGLISAMTGSPLPTAARVADTQASAARARAAVMAAERALGNVPVDREWDRLGYDIESAIPGTGKLRFLEVKGRVSGADDVTVTKNELLYGLHQPDDLILAIVEFTSDDAERVHYVRRPFEGLGVTTDFNGSSVDIPLRQLLGRATGPA
ncbi:MAG: helicase-related protein [Chloroflexota bacterium]